MKVYVCMCMCVLMCSWVWVGVYGCVGMCSPMCMGKLSSQEPHIITEVFISHSLLLWTSGWHLVFAKLRALVFHRWAWLWFWLAGPLVLA